MNNQALINEVLLVPRGAHLVFPGVQCIDRADWHQLIAPAFKEGGLNGVSLAILDESKASEIIDNTIRTYEELGVRFRWTVGPDSRPFDLGARLEARGLQPVAVAGMAATYGGAQERDPEIDVDLVGPDSIDEFNDVMSEGWGMSSATFCDYNAQVLRESAERNPFFLARIQGKGVGAAGYFAFPNSAYLIGGVVLPEFRRRGVYRALVQARQEHAQNRGISLATCHAIADSSAPVLTNLGFETVCQFTSYVGK